MCISEPKYLPRATFCNLLVSKRTYVCISGDGFRDSGYFFSTSLRTTLRLIGRRRSLFPPMLVHGVFIFNSRLRNGATKRRNFALLLDSVKFVHNYALRYIKFPSVHGTALSRCTLARLARQDNIDSAVSLQKSWQLYFQGLPLSTESLN